MNVKPDISIITICYNSEATIRKTIESVINQPSVEYIIIDGGSTDNTMSIVNEYKDRISTIISESDKGISDAFNKGINAANGQIIGLVNSDDYLLKDSIAILRKNIDQNTDIYRGDLEVRKNGKLYILKPTMNLSGRLWRANVCHPSTFIAKNAYIKYGLYNVNYKYSMDWELLCRFSESGARLRYLPYVMSSFDATGKTTNTKDDKQKAEAIEIMKHAGCRTSYIALFNAARNIIDAVKVIIKI